MEQRLWLQVECLVLLHFNHEDGNLVLPTSLCLFLSRAAVADVLHRCRMRSFGLDLYTVEFFMVSLWNVLHDPTGTAVRYKRTSLPPLSDLCTTRSDAQPGVLSIIVL